MHKDVADVAIDADDNVYLLTRFDVAVIVYDRAGRFLRSWGRDAFTSRPHGITIGPDGHVYVVDEDDQTVKKFTKHGDRLARLGTSGEPTDTGYNASAGGVKARVTSIKRSAGPFNQPTAVAVTEGGDVGSSPMATATRGSTTSLPTAPSSTPGESPAPHRASSTFLTRSPWTIADGFWSPIGRTIGSRCSRRTATSSRSGPTYSVPRRRLSTARAWCSCRRSPGRRATGRGSTERSTRTDRHASRSWTARPARSCVGWRWARGRIHAQRATSPRRTASRSTRAGISTSLR